MIGKLYKVGDRYCFDCHEPTVWRYLTTWAHVRHVGGARFSIDECIPGEPEHVHGVLRRIYGAVADETVNA